MIRSLTTHIHGNRWLWTGLMTALAAICWALRVEFGAGYHFGDVMAIALMVVGTLVILKSQEGYDPPRIEV